MNLLNIFEDSNTPGSNYAEELAYQIFKAAPNLDATGAADEVLDYAFDLAVNDLGRKRAHSLFAYDEDFDGDLVSAYAHLQRQGVAKGHETADDYQAKAQWLRQNLHVSPDEAWEMAYDTDPETWVGSPWEDDYKSSVAEGEVYDLEKEYGYEKPKTQPKRVSVPPTRPSLHPEDTDFMDPVERRLRADQARVKAAWAAHNAKKDTNESRMSELDAEYQDYKKLSPREFYNMYRITKQAWLAKYKSMLPQQKVQESKKKVNESVFLKEDRQRLHEQWARVGQHLVEYKLTPAQIQDLFGRVEQAATAAGGNRTLAGRGVDKATELNAAWEELKGQIQQSRPVKGFDDLYDTAAAKLKTATGGDEGVMQYVNKYRAFAKEHPYIQSAVYAALIAAAGLSGAGLGGAGALGLLKMTDRLLQGDKASSALYKGAKTGALAMAAHSIADYFKNPNAQIPPGTPAKLPNGTEYVVQKGDTLSQIAQRNGVSVKDLMAANSGQTVPTGDRITWNDPNAFTDINPMGDAVPSGTGSEPTYDVRTKLTNPDVLQPGQKLNVPGSLGPTQTYADGVGTAADTWDKVKSGQYTPSEISRNQAAKWNLPGAGEYNPPSGTRIPADQAPMFDPTGGAASLSKPDYNKYDDGASQLKPDAEFMKMRGDAGERPTLTPKGDEVDYASSKTNPWDRANAKVDADVAAQNAEIDAQNAKASAEYSDWLAKNPGSPVPYDQDGNLMPGWVDDPEKPGFLKFNAPKLKESQIFAMFDAAVAGQRSLNEGMWDSIKGAAGKAADWAKTKGHNITTKVTLDKLLQAWNKAGKPTDSADLSKLMLKAGVTQPVIDSVFASMKIPAAASAPAQQTGVQGRVEPTMTATKSAQTPTATRQVQPAQWNYSDAANAAGVGQNTTAAKPAALPSWADPKSSDYVGRREVARRQAAQPATTAKPAAPAQPQWTAGTGAYSTQAAKQQPATKPVATPTAKPGIAAPKLSSAEYIKRIGIDEDNGVKFAAEVGSKALGNANMGLLIKAYHANTPRITLHFGNRGIDLDNNDIEAIARYYDEQLTDPNDRWAFIYNTMSNPDQLTSVLAKIGRRSQRAVQQPGLFQEANKEDDEPKTRDVALQRAITRAKADFPTAGSGIEALAKDFMRSQDQDQKSFDQLRQAERQQDQMLSKIAKIDQEQENEIKDLENQNSTLATRLQQLQNVNGQLEKKLAAMAGRGEKRKADKAQAAIEPAAKSAKVDIAAPKDSDNKPAKTEPKGKAAKIPNVSYKIKPTKVEPKATAKQKNADVLDAPKAPPSFGGFRGGDIQDIAHKMIRQPEVNVGNRDELEKAAQDVGLALPNNPSPTLPTADINQKQKDLFAAENKDKEAKYGNKYQDMVKRMGQKAREQEKSKPLDIADLARRLAAIEASKKD